MHRLPFQIKICGLRTSEDAHSAIQAGAGAIGLNFYPHSKRFVMQHEAVKIASELPPGAILFGVFVNANPSDILAANSSEQIPHFETERTFEFHEASRKQASPRSTQLFDWVQCHGAESPKTIASIKGELQMPVIRAFPWGPGAAGYIEGFLSDISQLSSALDAILIDSHKPGEYGGTGETADWKEIADWRKIAIRYSINFGRRFDPGERRRRDRHCATRCRRYRQRR